MVRTSIDARMSIVRAIARIFTVLIFLAAVLVGLAYIFFGPVGESDKAVVFVVPENTIKFDPVKSLYEQNLIKSEKAFTFLLNNFAGNKPIKPGGYRIRLDMNSWEVMKKITGEPDLFWLTISFCARKEQVGEKIAGVLSWSDKELEEWNNLYSDKNTEYYEGVYYPDTYLLPKDETPSQIAERFIGNFNEKFSPLADEYAAKNIKWTTGLKIASLIAREAAGKEDMKIISGVIWNRLNKEMPLQIDATMQYTLGKNPDGTWWGNINLDQKGSDSPYNSYKHKGLPPTPICSPNIDAIEAALNPEETDCLFYLHDKMGNIHCAATYTEHLENIDTFLR